MKTHILVAVICLLSVSVFGQKWSYAFMNADSTLYGFKSPDGKVIAEPKFMLVGNEQFKDIVSVIEEVSSDKYSAYYLRADGTKFGVDSVYFFDQAPDIESNGFIRFQDPVSKKIGVMNVAGKVVLSPEFDQIMELRNGFVWGIRGAAMECWDKDVPIENCEHRSWVGGEKVLYNVKGELLSRDFFSNPDSYVNLDYYTFQKSKKASKDPFRKSFKAAEKGYFSMVDLDKTFDSWIQKNWFKNPSASQLDLLIGDTVVVWDEENGWIPLSRARFLSSKSKEVNALAEVIKEKKYSSFNSYQEDLFFFDFQSLFGQYFNGAYQFNHWKYPAYEVIIDNSDKGHQSHLMFLRTKKGWELISITLT